jgi:TetR/AcrR family transcriptional regulator, regulator of autoinduction and epiphytic fitness
MTTRTTGEIQREDGRSVRSARTRSAVVEAFLELIDDGQLRPTAKAVSKRAGVSLRSVFQHFADLEALFAAAADRQVERLAELAVRIPAEAPFEERLRMFVDGRARLFERISPVRRASLLWEPFSPEIARRMKWSRDTNREESRRVFGRELTNVDDSKQVESALHAATEWYTWETLRVHDGLSIQQATNVMSHMVSALLKKED